MGVLMDLFERGTRGKEKRQGTASISLLSMFVFVCFFLPLRHTLPSPRHTPCDRFCGEMGVVMDV